MLLGVTKVNTFKDLLRLVFNMERMSPHTMPSFMNNRPQRGAQAETKVAFTSLKDKMVANANTQSGSGSTSGNNYSRGPRPNPGGNSQGFETLKQKKAKPYSFRKDKFAQIFRGALKNGLALPASKRPEDANKSDEPNFCPYHRILGHSIENCWVFKDWVEKAYKNGEITLPQGFLQSLAAHEQANMISHKGEKGLSQTTQGGKGTLNECFPHQIRESCCMIVVEVLDDELKEDNTPILKNVLKQLERESNTVDELTKINLGTEEDPRPTFINASLPEEVADKLKTFLRGYMDCFAWSYKQMPGLDPKVAVHYLKIDPTFRPIKQVSRRIRVELEEKVVEETKKPIDAGFIREEETAEWVASIVPVKKKNGQIHIYVDFRDLNKSCPKDDFPLPVTEIIIDHTSSYEVFSFMDGYAGYNQIKMAAEDEKHTAFCTPIGIYCYKVMPFGLKNAGATYQRAMTKIFDDMIHKIVECYVDDLVIKAMSYEEHLQHLEVVFSRLREHALKCACHMAPSGAHLSVIL
jgi:Reverse transcriptase (RNA-dependent DNA polymerase)